jgi:hypothetical protein
MQALLISLFMLGVVYWLQDRFGHRCSGFCAGLPLLTLVTVVNTALRFDLQALQAVLHGCLIAIAAAAIAIKVYSRLHRFSPLLSLAIAFSLFAIVVKTVLHQPARTSLALLLISLSAITLTLCLPDAHALTDGKASQDKPVMSQTISRLVGLGLVGCAFVSIHYLPAVFAGIIASAPVMGFSAMLSAHSATAKQQRLQATARGYAEGLLVKWGFIAGTLAGVQYQTSVFFVLSLGALFALCLSGIVWFIHRGVHTNRQTA